MQFLIQFWELLFGTSSLESKKFDCNVLRRANCKIVYQQ
nr:MAG TPA: hypothetical protein [Caudoviricetes sp.]